MSPAPDASSRALARLLEVMRRLRDPVDGCPWDLLQTHATIAPYTIEEAYEAADAIEREDPSDLQDELGDVLLQVVFQTQIAHEAGDFDFATVADAIADKMIRRHPHIFASIAPDASGPAAWEKIKADERRAKAERSGDTAPESALDGVAATLPALLLAYKLQKRAARIGFDFPNWRGALAKTHEELLEVIKAQSESAQATEEEIGDLLFAAVNLARTLDIDPDQALKRANAKFRNRFTAMEQRLRANGVAPADADIDTQEAAWIAAKRAERRPIS